MWGSTSTCADSVPRVYSWHANGEVDSIPDGERSEGVVTW